ncbi:hypothetical protein BS50DRAFT_619946 [Corynespora cassiicola Philippines]|uniref:Extracellular mutant protein 11 C-terminal domain-containing protein n=1 Tax=Corynespora cassiicola Philippines TaxID=1448308 RepID=A0A2T2NV96_CORCC|nr:hypothetical protein BS50DRAFT_619946 [Corynespora cassiicola Philippines]
MRSFVNKGGRSGSPAPPQANTNRRANAAATAKVNIPRTQLGQPQEPLIQQNDSRQRRDLNGGFPTTQQKLQHQPGPIRKNTTLYDTDVESIDTTINDRSVVQVEGSQQTNQNQYYQNYSGDIDEYQETGVGEEEGELPSEAVEEVEEKVEEIVEEAGARSGAMAKRYGLEEHQDEIKKRFDARKPEHHAEFAQVDGDSYPTTTDGATEVSHEPNNGKALPSGDHNYDNALLSLPAQYMVNPQLMPTMASHRVQRPRSTLDEAAALRKQERLRDPPRQEAGLPMRGGALKSGHVAEPPMAQPQPRRPYIVNEVPSRPLQANTNITQPLHAKVTLLPAPYAGQSVAGPLNSLPYGGSQATGYPQKQKGLATPALSSTISGRQEPPILHSKESTNQYQQKLIEDEPEFGDEQPPMRDYDEEELYKMDYNQLKNESFDYDPRAKDHVLPENIQQKPLEERLKYVQHHHDAKEQGKFFSMLPTDEWEEAGDWFLDQFSTIIDQTRKARQKKRKLAKTFEKEVEQRHDRVTKRQKQVQDAMDKMKVQGQGLVPKSPLRG